VYIFTKRVADSLDLVTL